MKVASKEYNSQIKISRVWKNCNDSMVFLLPLLSPKNKKFITKTYPQIEFSFLQICFDYGLINTFLFRNENEKTGNQHNSLYVLFNRSLVTSSLTKTTIFNSSLHNVLVNSGYFKTISSFGQNLKYSLYEMQIPEKFVTDIKTILKSNYSKVSSSYQNYVRITGKDLPFNSHPLGLYMSVNNMPYSITNKSTFLRKEIEIAIDQNIPEGLEYYTKFRMDKEVFNQEEYLI